MKAIINNNYFKRDIYLPKSDLSITSDVTDEDGDVKSFIEEYVEDCLSKCLGPLFIEFVSKLDSTQENGLVENSDEKWDWLLNGRQSYLDVNGNKKRFRGIRFKSSSIENSEYDKSLLAYYVYYMHQSDTYISTTGVGNSIPKAKNAEVVTPSFKMIKAWRKFYFYTVGSYFNKQVFKEVYNNNIYGGYGVDYFQENNFDSSLYEFIIDMNNIDESNYPDFKPKKWLNTNQMGI